MGSVCCCGSLAEPRFRYPFTEREILHGVDITLLDEPTATLDPRAEHELFERYTDLTAAARARGAVTVLVSHPFRNAGGRAARARRPPDRA